MPTHIKMEFAQLSAAERGENDDMSSMSVFWELAQHPVGVWVKYTQDVGHKQAFSVLAEGIWEALQNPDNFNVGRDGPDVDDLGNPPPYAVLLDDVASE